MVGDGRVEFIHIAEAAGQPMQAVATAAAIAGVGLRGDRYAAGTGHWSSIHRNGDQLTIVDAEELERVATANQLHLPPGATRRNITARGIELDALIGRRFRIGGIECRGARRCQPCSYLDELLGQDALPVLIHRAGIRAEITTGGPIAVGDALQLLAD